MGALKKRSAEPFSVLSGTRVQSSLKMVFYKKNGSKTLYKTFFFLPRTIFSEFWILVLDRTKNVSADPFFSGNPYRIGLKDLWFMVTPKDWP
jgi:hypothetical protein